jgi:hypothetical protein
LNNSNPLKTWGEFTETNKDPQNTLQKSKDWTTQNHSKLGVNSQRQTKVHRTHYRKVKIEQLEPTENLGWIQMLWKGTVPVIIVAPVVLLPSKNPMMNHYMKEERRRLWLQYAEYIHCSLWHRYSACHDSDRKILKLSFLVCSNPLSRKYKLVHEYKKCTINEKYAPMHMQRLLECSYKR